MRGRRAWLLVGGASWLVTALAVALIVAARQVPVGAQRSPIAVVLVPALEGSELVSVDLDAGRVVGRLRLRSLVTDIDADPETGIVVGAQTGGIGDSADDALSLSDPRIGTVRYVKLPRIDPSQVECVGGRAMALHAVVEGAGFVVSGVDLASGAAVSAGHVPEGPGMWAAAAGAVWTAVPTEGPVPYALLRVDPATLATACGPGLPFSPYGATVTGDSFLVLGESGKGDTTRAWAALLDGKAAKVTASVEVTGLAHGAQIAAAVGDVLVVGDWNGDVPETGSLRVLERASLRPLGTIDVGGAPCALASHDGRLLVVDRVSGTLAQLDPRTGAADWRVSLGGTDLVCSKIVVLPGGAQGGTAPNRDEAPRTADASGVRRSVVPRAF